MHGEYDVQTDFVKRPILLSYAIEIQGMNYVEVLK
jgi:hypothetical protein